MSVCCCATFSIRDEMLRSYAIIVAIMRGMMIFDYVMQRYARAQAARQAREECSVIAVEKSAAGARHRAYGAAIEEAVRCAMARAGARRDGETAFMKSAAARIEARALFQRHIVYAR